MEPSSLSTRPSSPSSWRGGGDSRLVRQAARGDEAAFAAIFSRHHEALFRYCRSIVGNEHDATDALQSTMVKALEKLPGETRRIALRPWLFRIAHNESIDLLRARRPHADLDAAIDVSDRVSSTELETRERLHALEADLQRLTQQQRSALLLRELVGLSFAETSAALGITPSAAKQSVYEARQALHTREEGRAMDCDALCRSLSDGDRRTLRGKAVKAHLESCGGCRAFEAALRRRPTDLGLLAPLPAAGGLGGLGFLGASAAGTAGVGAGTAAGGGFLSGVLPGLSATVGTKVAAALAVGAVAIGGVTVAERGGDGAGAGPEAAQAAQEGAGGPTGGTGGAGGGGTGASGETRDERGVTGESGERPKLRGAADRREGAGAGGDDPDPSAGEPRSATPNADTRSDAPPAADAPTRDRSGAGSGRSREGGRDAAADARDDDAPRETAPSDRAPKPDSSPADKAKADKAKADKAKADRAKADKAKADRAKAEKAKPERPKDPAPGPDAPKDGAAPAPKPPTPNGQAPTPGPGAAGSAPAGRPESPGRPESAGSGRPKGGDEDEDEDEDDGDDDEDDDRDDD
ncbi:sigma-70 family RNA polymerase sigma factor [Patulibacter americanus]|uniref:sigma-70 family RNA polymerase sigma factor n=1 Tax=Patulibacter americanus TaxID=588672 RepID=UPI0003B5F351|nr:RNA polymerase sigma factor [Patulibacter americanus]